MQGRKFHLGLSIVILVTMLLSVVPVLAQAPAGEPAWGADIMPDVPREEIAAKIKEEGSILRVSGFASGEVRSQYHPMWFQEWVREVYGVPVHVQFVPAEGDQIIEQLKGRGENDPAPVDLIGTENMFVNQAIQQGLIVSDTMDSPLIPLAKQLPDLMKMSNSAFRIQGIDGIFMVYNPKYVAEEDIAQVKTWLDVAKIYPKYAGKILWWHPVGDPAGLAQIISITMDRGGDYKNNDDIRTSIEWIKENIDPHVLRYVRGYGDFTVLVEKEEAHIAVMWYGTSKKYILDELVKPIWLTNCMSMSGYMAMTKGTPHPTLAQLYMNFQMSHYVQYPPYPPEPPYQMFEIAQANWLRAVFGGVGIPGEYDKYMPEWAKAIVPPAEVVNQKFVDVDWDYVFAHKGEWQEMWSEIIGD